MDTNEVLALLNLAERAQAHGTFPNIRAAAIARLNEIEAELAPQPAEEPAAEEENA